MRNWKIGAKLLAILLVSALVPLIFIAVLSVTTMRGLSGQSTRAITQLGTQTGLDARLALQTQAEEYLEKIAREQALKTDAMLERVEQELEAVADYLTALYAGAEAFAAVDLPLPFETEDGAPSAKHMVAPGEESTPELAAEIGLLGNATYMVAPVYESNVSMSNLYLGTPGGIVYRYSARNNYDESYDPRLRPWYQLAVSAGGQPVWTATELDSYGILCTTVALAYYSSEGSLLGVLASDITLEQMQQDITATRIGETGYAYLVEADGAVVAHPYMQSTGETAHQLPAMALYAGKAGLFETDLEGDACYVAYHRLPTTGWYFAVVTEVAEIVAPALAMGEAIEEYLHTSQESISGALWQVLVQFVLLLAAAVLVILPVALLLARTITRPLKQLLEAAEHLGGGDLDYRAEVAGQDEVAQLAGAFNQMGERLQQHLKQVQSLTAQQQRAETELAIAAKIQAGMLPLPFMQTGGAAIAAAMHPAREIGGDFYDYFLLDDTRLFLCIADVSGKGVPAALYMARAKTLLAHCLRRGEGLAAAVDSANRQLAAGNEENMFVTAFAALLDCETGVLTYCNAGHNPPLLYTGAGVALLPVQKGLALGCMQETVYAQQQVTLAAGDRLVMYTDGVTEAENPEGSFYGERRLFRLLEGRGRLPLEQLAPAVCENVTGFANGASQADDITLLVLEKL